MHRSGPLYPPLGIAVPALRVQVGIAEGKAGTPTDATSGAARGRICRQQSQTGRWMSEKADMTVSMRHTEGTVPSVPTFLSRNRFLTGGLYMTWLETQRRARVRARVSHIGGWCSAGGGWVQRVQRVQPHDVHAGRSRAPTGRPEGSG